jgi:hypothetical protein
LLRSSVACLRSPQRFPTDACPPELLPSEKRCPRRREPLPPCRSPANAAATSRPSSARKSVATKVRGRTSSPAALLGFPSGAPPDRACRAAREREASACTSGPRERGPVRWPIRDDHATAARRPRPRRTRGGGKIGAASLLHHAPMDHDRLHHRRSDALSGLHPERRIVVPGPSSRRPASPSDTCTASRPKARALQWHPRRPWSLAPRGLARPTADHKGRCRSDRPVCSTAFREVGGGCRGGPRCGWVDRVPVRHPGSGDRSGTPASAG